MSDHLEHLRNDIVKRAPLHKREHMDAMVLGAYNKGIRDRLLAGTAGYEDVKTPNWIIEAIRGTPR
jgi:hypothetical protein